MDWIKIALEIGFEDVRSLNLGNLTPLSEVREMCSADRCRSFGKSWSCPPACGSLERCSERIRAYSSGVLVQTVGTLEDEFDTEGIASTHKKHSLRFAALARQARLLSGDCLPLSAGTCTRCLVCSYPKSPCRYPNKAFSSMEAYGLLVSEVCENSGMPYYRGENKITFTSCILFK